MFGVTVHEQLCKNHICISVALSHRILKNSQQSNRWLIRQSLNLNQSQIKTKTCLQRKPTTVFHFGKYNSLFRGRPPITKSTPITVHGF